MSSIIEQQMKEEAAKRDAKNGPTLAELIASAGHDLDNSAVRGGGADKMTQAVRGRNVQPELWGVHFRREHTDMKKQSVSRKIAIALILVATAVLLATVLYLASIGAI